MARNDAVWGIDIGNCSLKAIRLRPGSQSDQVIAEAFDFIEYPKILTQPGAEPVELIQDALKQFLSRNSVKGDRVAISVSGQNGLARFIKLPPVEVKKIPDIVRYEARQQIPFDLQDVVWDYQRMSGSSEEIEGFVLETEIGLFAMKRDQVFRALKPFDDAGIPVEIVQLTPLALYNYVAFDELRDQPSPEEIDPDNPPPSVVVLSLGTDATDLVVTNGMRVWQRSVPIGGNHFTKALTKELKLTFAKAEHLKRNATTAEDPKAVFQAMRPVFSDLLTEVQRSIGYFTSIDRTAKIDRVLALGNAMKLPGLRRYLSQSLGFEVLRADAFRGMTGPEVINAPAFQENQLSFGVAYGLALQGMGKGALRTNLLPKEILKDRMIREKKPWAVAAAALLLLAFTISFVSHSMALSTVAESLFGQAETAATQVTGEASRLAGEANTARGQFESTDAIGQNLISNVEGRVLWLELLRALNACLPADPAGKRPEEIELRNELHVYNVECEWTENLENWFGLMKQQNWYQPPRAQAPAAAPAADPAAAPADEPGPSGPGWVIQLSGYHYHNKDVAGGNQGAEFIRNTIIRELNFGKVILPTPDGQNVEPVSMKELGIGFPVLVDPRQTKVVTVVDPYAEPAAAAPGAPGAAPAAAVGPMPGMMGAMPAGAAMPGEMSGMGAMNPNQVKVITLRRFDFIVQFCWQPTPPTARHEKKQAPPAAEGAPAAAPAAEKVTKN
ncbi:MAG: type IV pilus assembly protein PilM [Pirellulales bacterium]|nr:type IV pilus assembly protein PilM [Pirellulales bacterium]